MNLLRKKTVILTLLLLVNVSIFAEIIFTDDFENARLKTWVFSSEGGARTPHEPQQGKASLELFSGGKAMLKVDIKPQALQIISIP